MGSLYDASEVKKKKGKATLKTKEGEKQTLIQHPFSHTNGGTALAALAPSHAFVVAPVAPERVAHAGLWAG